LSAAKAQISMTNSGNKVSRYGVAIIVISGVIWVFSAAFYSAQIVSCFPACGSVALPPGIATTGYPPQAVRYLAWDDLYSNLYIGTIGILAIAIGLKAFRRGEKWAWYSILAFALAGFLTGLLDYLSWGGWYTSLFFGLPPLVGLPLSAKSFFQRKPRV
jgi:hypothetical protein